MLSIEWELFAFAAVSLFCLLSSKISSRINMPTLLLFLAVGFITGYHDNRQYDPEQINLVGSAAMAFILFSGGYDTEWKSIRSVLSTGTLLASVGILMTALFTALLSYFLLKIFLPNISFTACLLVGCIVSSTDAAAVFSILRSKSVSLKGHLQPLLELESGSNDPMAAFLTIFIVEIIRKELLNGAGSVPWQEYLKIFPAFLCKMSLGIAIGYAVGKISIWLYNKIDFDYNGLYYVLAVVVVLLSYSATEIVKGNGFMAVYVAGLVMGNAKFVFHNGVGKFYNGLSWLAQVVLFTTLGYVADHSVFHNSKISIIGLCVALILMFAARPLAVFLTMIRSPFSFKEKTLISWVGLRGGAPIMLATIPMMKLADFAGEIPFYTQLIFHTVFFIVITSVLLQGMTIMPLAKLLKLDAPLKKNPRNPLSWEETGDASSDSREVPVPAALDGTTIAGLHLPAGALILLIRRDEKFLVPRGDTVLQCDDVLTLMGSPEALKQAAEQLA